MLPDWMRRLFRRKNRRSTLSAGFRGPESLEARQLLVATIVNALPDSAVGSAGLNLDLGSYFDDPDITGTTAQIQTVLGSFFVETFDQITPVTVANFVSLTEAGRYDDMFFHRSVPGFVLQGGGFNWPQDGNVGTIQNNGSVVNEFDRWFDPDIGGLAAGTNLNTRGTLAMAKQGGDPDSATSQWFVNAANNAANLDNQNGGFTVFAQVLFDGMDVVDNIMGLQRVDAGTVFSTLPVQQFVSGSSIGRNNVITSDTTIVEELSYQLTANTNSDLVDASIVDGQLQLTAAGTTKGDAQITVQATDLQGNVVTQTLNVSVAAPATTTVTGPGDGTDRRPEISWNSVGNADSYDLWVTHVGVQNGLINVSNITSNRFVPETDLADGIYRVWVRARNQLGASAWSPVHTFSVGAQKPAAVTITAPAAVVDNRRPTMEWTASATATSYDLWVNHLGVKNQIIRETDVTATSFTPSEDLATGTYRLWVKAKNASGESTWSAPVTFQIEDNSVVRIVGPTGSGSARPEIVWTGPDSVFELWVNQVGGTPRIIHETTIAGRSFTPGFDLTAGTYRGWVRERPTSGTPGPWSAAFGFEVADANAPSVPAIAGVTALNTARPVFTFMAAQNAATYELWVNRVGGAARVIHVTDLTELVLTAPNDVAAGTYRAWLRAFNGSGEASGWSAAFEFQVV